MDNLSEHTSTPVRQDGSENIAATDNDGGSHTHKAITEKDLPRAMFQDDYPKEILRDDIATAVMQPRADIVRFLVKKFLETARATNETGDSLLHDAALLGEDEVIDVLVLELKLDVNQPNNSGETPLHIAASQGNVKAMERLMAQGADINKADQSGDTPLHAAAWRHKSETCNFLLGQGASVDPRNGSNQTPLYVACQSGNDDVVETLLYHGADPNLWADGMSSPLHAAAEHYPGAEYLAICRMLVAAGAEMNHKRFDGWTPMHLAVDLGCAPLVKLLLLQGANPNIVNNEGNTPLQMALRTGDRVVLRVMVDHEGDNVIDFHMGEAREMLLST
ncbi:hypothetical protein DL770_003799 [Monosporascus sp. CRB-9-2]|nr:hypothetical protein DL770_003799 [Monosporascus sp. CRB-9-2]